MECCICLEEINDDFTTTSCNHHFHKNCLQRWFKDQPSYKHGGWGKCPMCRRPSFEDDEFNLKPSAFQILRSTVKRMLVVKI